VDTKLKNTNTIRKINTRFSFVTISLFLHTCTSLSSVFSLPSYMYFSFLCFLSSLIHVLLFPLFSLFLNTCTYLSFSSIYFSARVRVLLLCVCYVQNDFPVYPLIGVSSLPAPHLPILCVCVFHFFYFSIIFALQARDTDLLEIAQSQIWRHTA